jgi:hypothetical protein
MSEDVRSPRAFTPQALSRTHGDTTHTGGIVEESIRYRGGKEIDLISSLWRMVCQT